MKKFELENMTIQKYSKGMTIKIEELGVKSIVALTEKEVKELKEKVIKTLTPFKKGHPYYPRKQVIAYV